MKLTNQKLAMLLAVLAFVLNCVTYSPGFMSPDSLDQYRQALSNIYVEWHPPVMAYLWHLLNYIHKGPQIVLAFQLLLLWGAYYMIATASDKRTWVLGTFVAFFLAPFIHNFAGYIIKDVQMGLCWLFVAATLIKYLVLNKRMPLILQVLTVIAVMYGSWVRYNSLSALPPICLLWSWVVFRDKKRVSKIVVALALFAGVVAGQKIFLNWLKPARSYPQDVLYMHDLSAMMVKTGKDVFPPVMYQNPQFDTAYIRSIFHPASYDHVWWNAANKQLVVLNDSVDKALHDAWVHMVKTDTRQYLLNRWETFTYFTRFRQHSPIMFMFPWIHPNEFGYVVKEERIFYNTFYAYMSAQWEIFYLQTWFWVLLNILLFAAIPLVKNSRIRFGYVCLLLSGLFYILPQYILATTDKEFRYVYWVCLACMLAVILLFADRVIRQDKPLPKKTGG